MHFRSLDRDDKRVQSKTDSGNAHNGIYRGAYRRVEPACNIRNVIWVIASKQTDLLLVVGFNVDGEEICGPEE